MSNGRLELSRISTDIRLLQEHLAVERKLSSSVVERLDDETADNLLAAYAKVDKLLEQRIDLFAYGNSGYWLELNSLVLCGTSVARRAEYALHIAATEQRFYGDQSNGFGAIVDWHSQHRGQSSWARAAGIYVGMVSEPQLFVEGNQRTGCIIMSHILASCGEPPFVVSVANAKRFFKLSDAIRSTSRTGYNRLFGLASMRRELASLLEESADRGWLTAVA